MEGPPTTGGACSSKDTELAGFLVPMPSAPSAEAAADIEEPAADRSAESAPEKGGERADVFVARPCVHASGVGSSNPGAAHEVHMDNAELCAQPCDDWGTLVVTAVPWSLRHFFRSREFSLVLRNPRDPTRGLALVTSADQREVKKAARDILGVLGEGSSTLADPATYNALAEPATQRAFLAEVAGGTGQSERAVAALAGLPAASAPPDEGQAASAPPDDGEAGQCPICFDGIQPADAAMRCSGDGGVYHYFHAACLRDWIRVASARRQATCPICRGCLQFNGRRLEQFLQGDASSGLDTDDRSFLQSISDGLSGSNTWREMNAVERTAYAGGLLASATWGFTRAYMGTRDRLVDSMLFSELPTEHQVAQAFGWVAGSLALALRTAYRNKRRRED